MHAQPEWPPSGGSTAQDEQRRASGRGASTSTSTSTQCPDPAACPPTSNKTEKKAEKPSEQPVSAGASPTAGAEEAPPGADPLNALPPELWPPDPPRERYLLFAENDRRQAVHMIVKELRASGQCHILALADPDIIMTLNVLRKAQDRLAAVARDPQLLIKVVCSPDKDEGSPALAGEENPAEFALLFHVVLHSHAAVQQHLALGVAAPCTLLPDPGSQAPNYLRLAYPADLDPASHWKSQKRFSGRVMQELASFGVAHVSVTSSLAAAAAVRVIAMVTDALCITRDLEAVMALSYGRGAQSERDGQRDAALPRTVFTLMLAVGMDPELHGAQLPLLARCVERRRGWEQQAAEQQRQEQQQQRQQQLQQRRQQQLQQQQQQQQQQSDGGSGVHAEASIASATDGPRTLQQQQQQQQGRQSPRQQQQRRQRLRGRQKGVSLQLVDPRDLPPETAPQPQGYWVEESNGKHVWHTWVPLKADHNVDLDLDLVTPSNAI